MKKGFLSVGCATAGLIVLTILSPPVNGQSPFPEGPGRDTLFLACSQCHSVAKMVGTELTAEDWQFTVYDMIARGAPVHIEDIDVLTKYLQDNFATDGQ